jgi:phosphatidylinositol-3-phosphatase
MKPGRLIAALAMVLAVGLASTAKAALPPIKHVFVIVMENKDYDVTFGANSPAPYLAKELPRQGLLLPNYYGTAHLSLGNYIGMLSGQGPNPITQSDCQVFLDVFPGTIGADGQASGFGCVYPASVKTLADQLTAKGMTWGGYMEDMGNSTTQSKTCRHPALFSVDDTQTAEAGDQYAARHNPFVYFHSIIDSPDCDAFNVPLERLEGDLRSMTTTPNYVFITPNLCHDGHDEPCVDGQPGGLVSIDLFLRDWIPRIQASPAYRDGGLIVVTFDESENGAEGCCNEVAANTPNAGGETIGPGGGKIGAVLLSPYIRPGTVVQKEFNHYSLLRSTEDIFGLPHLGYAESPNPGAFTDDMFDPSRCFDHPLPEGAGDVLAPGTVIASARIKHARKKKKAKTKGRDTLTLAMQRTADLSIKTKVGKKLKKVGLTHGEACQSYSVKLPRKHQAVRIVATVGDSSESRKLKK